ncbi:MAG: Sec-independent protein translocase protein TatB [Azonexus sp.]|jgi:sec-independent protein translocase protein TatB|nr:Sec-independent protein translocase protein TatB [Azonexus sp.]
MFDIGFSELIVIGIVALVVIGPERLPRVARTVGHLLGRAQRYVNDVKSDINREIQLDELKKLQSQVAESAHGIEGFVRKELDFTRNAIEEPLKTAASEIEALKDTDAAPPVTENPVEPPAKPTA